MNEAGLQAGDIEVARPARVGAFQARRASMRWPRVLLSGAAPAAIGVVMVPVEAFFD